MKAFKALQICVKSLNIRSKFGEDGLPRSASKYLRFGGGTIKRVQTFKGPGTQSVTKNNWYQ